MSPTHQVAVSIPVHEAFDCVIDQAKNWKAFAPAASPVFHISAQAPFGVDELSSALRDANPMAVVNPERLETGWADGSLIKAHLSNYKYAKQLMNPYYFAMDASNTLLVKHGLVEHMMQHFSVENAVAGHNLPCPTIEGISAHAMHEDTEFQMSIMLSSRFMPEVGVVPCEGAWFDAIRFERVAEIIVDWKWDGKYATEEVYPVAAWNFVARPISRVAGNYIMSPFEANLYVTKDDVIAIHYGDHKNKDLFGVKHVPREIDHPIRKMIRDLGGY
jgi:hypothetical protein